MDIISKHAQRFFEIFYPVVATRNGFETLTWL